MKKEIKIKFCCHKCGEEIPLDKTKLNCPHCDHSISWMRIRVKEHWAETHYEVLV
jgi:Zn finger protein HypA/HybF involved in hydrogenase expression